MRRDEEFFHAIVLPTVNEFLRDPRDLRRGYLASIVLRHLMDYWKEAASGDEMAFRAACPEFKLICDVSNTAKHMKEDARQKRKKGLPPREIVHVDQISAERNEGLFKAPFGFGGFAEPALVWLLPKTMGTVPLEKIMRAVLAKWHEKYSAA